MLVRSGLGPGTQVCKEAGQQLPEKALQLGVDFVRQGASLDASAAALMLGSQASNHCTLH